MMVRPDKGKKKEAEREKVFACRNRKWMKTVSQNPEQ